MSYIGLKEPLEGMGVVWVKTGCSGHSSDKLGVSPRVAIPQALRETCASIWTPSWHLISLHNSDFKLPSFSFFASHASSPLYPRESLAPSPLHTLLSLAVDCIFLLILFFREWTPFPNNHHLKPVLQGCAASERWTQPTLSDPCSAALAPQSTPHVHGDHSPDMEITAAPPPQLQTAC